jgi:hypothetical protein
MRLLDRILGRASSPNTSEAAEGYCLRCKTHREIRDPTRMYTKNGKPRVHGYCTVCNAEMSRLVKA